MIEVTFGFVKPEAYSRRREILEFIKSSGLDIVKGGEKDPFYFTEELAREHYEEHEGKSFFDLVVNHAVYGSSGLDTRRRY